MSAVVGKALPFRHVQQCGANWCWAACTEMMLRSVGRKRKQCKIASDVIGENCCSDCTAEKCDRTVDENGVTLIHHKNGLTTVRSDTPLTFDEVKNEIDHNRSIEAGIVFGKESGHLIVIAGWLPDPKQVLIRDPADDTERYIPWNNLIKSYSTGTWTYTWTIVSSP